MRRCTKDFHHFFGHSQSVSLHVLWDRFSAVSGRIQLPGGKVMSHLLWNEYTLPFSSVYGPAHWIFAYTKVRKEIHHREIATRQHTENFGHFFESQLSVLLAISLDCFSGVLCRIWLPEEGLELEIGCMVWNEEKPPETAIFLKKEGMGLETKKETIQIDDLPAVKAPSFVHNPQYMPEKTNNCQSISPSIKNQVSTTIRKQAQTNNYLLKSDSLTILYVLSCSSSSPITHRSCYHEQSSNRWISLSTREKVSSTITQQLPAANFKSTNITYQIQRLSIGFVAPGIGRRRINEDRNQSKVTSAK